MTLSGETRGSALQRDPSGTLFHKKPLPPREAQIATIVYERGGVTANQICEALGGTVTNAAVRSMLRRLIGKHVLRRFLRGHCYYYEPVEARQPNPPEVLRKVVEEHFGGCFIRAQAELERLRR